MRLHTIAVALAGDAGVLIMSVPLYAASIASAAKMVSTIEQGVSMIAMFNGRGRSQPDYIHEEIREMLETEAKKGEKMEGRIEAIDQ